MVIIVSDKGALVTSNAGMRLIAQQTLLNRGDFERLRGFVTESYAAAALEARSAEARLADLQAALAQSGRLRIYQVLAVDKHRVIALMQGQRDQAFYLTELAVEEDYPHRITEFSHNPLEA